MSQSERDPNVLSLPFVEELYAEFVKDPAAVTEDWRRYFEGVGDHDAFALDPRLGPGFLASTLFSHPSGSARTETRAGAVASTASGDAGGFLQDRVNQLVRSYRVRGHRHARLDPLGHERRILPELDYSYYGLKQEDLAKTCSLFTSQGQETCILGGLIQRMENTYCRSIGVQFYHIDALDRKNWLQERMESSQNRISLDRDLQLRILTRLTDAVIFEEFLAKKYTGSKSFSLEGGESLIPLLELAIEKAGAHGADEIVIGMAHRGRLNVLANIMGKGARKIFREFDDTTHQQFIGGGDVKYHLGHSSNWKTASGHTVHLSLCFNPSHLEFVNPVALGRLRAKQDRVGDDRGLHGVAFLIHGDAAMAGEGIVQETFNLGQLTGYRTGGTIHVVVNNQIGFTTDPKDSRSCHYASDVAKMLQIPIFHVNGEDPEAVAQVIDLAMDFRRDFGRDVVVDMYCYRRRGHNEGDEPGFTQPLMVREIVSRKSVLESYQEYLFGMGEVTPAEAAEIAVRRRTHLETELDVARSSDFSPEIQDRKGLWLGFDGGSVKEAKKVSTARNLEDLKSHLESMTTVPDSFTPHPKIKRLLRMRREMASGERPLDWAAGELLAFATLATEGRRIRLSGQDVQRGTFSQRHAVYTDCETGRRYEPLNHLSSFQAPVEIFNSPLSEAAVLGFDWGYSLDYPDALVIWEAQFGDFANAAQVIIDQFISSSEDKWNRLSGLVMMLPHGFEGMGPEHSSARLERYLQLCAEDNMQVCVPTTPAQHYHLLRRQTLRPWRKPLIIMTPKSLLRLPEASSSLDDLAMSTFRSVIPDPYVAGGSPERIILCAGKVYYDLVKKREDACRPEIPIIRIEELYPLDSDALGQSLATFPEGTPAYWVQEEPENMGAWWYLSTKLGPSLCGRFPFQCVCRPESASPATGSSGAHKMETERLLDRAFGLSDHVVKSNR